MTLTVLKWVLRGLTGLTVVLLCTNWAAIGIGLMAIDILVVVAYEMKKTACDRRQMHHLPEVHRM
ncbi:hypothetical protein [Lacticaseibacillus yichunensis]|uniref:Uncharacterized protein n=1 Tax=Lacticaseibacillus yichunensis TaxID=2486015 RepID=A0ABW4CPU3_9LACO|nr:hypothetical protein [Lacticaseibacillus yichunensis]